MKNILKLTLTISVLLLMYSTSAAQDKSEMVLNHVLLFKWNEGTSQETLNKAIHLLEGMTEKVDGFIKLKHYNLTTSSEGFNMIIIAQYSSEEALKNYESHSDHQKFADLVIPNLDKFAVNDFWFEN